MAGGMQVRVAEFNETTSFQDQLAAVSAAGVYVSVHTSNLANAPFLRPGAAVVELLQRNWVWHGLDKSFQARPPMHASILWHRVSSVGCRTVTYLLAGSCVDAKNKQRS